MERLPSVPVQSRAADPDWVPSQLARACSEGGDANQGRCKCGEAPFLQQRSWELWPGESVVHGKACSISWAFWGFT